ncbi:MAG: type II toxin-antitoxin system RelE/ParE family toxin [Proteobacteria bacterium]|nr:type II toxin-antitoxin system RelE/ParE family toxin [Pseudomonadota bacterium]
MTWKIEYADTARRQLRKIDRQMARRVVDFMDRRIAGTENPRGAGKALTGPLGGLWCYRVGDCRVICDIEDDALRVLVVRVSNRREIYRNQFSPDRLDN